MMRLCEVVAKLVCHASMLRCDDITIKGLNRSYRQCALCDLTSLDDGNHLLLQCPACQVEREQIFDDIKIIPDGSGMVALDNERDVLALPLGKTIHVLPMQQVEKLWLIMANGVYRIYRHNLKLKEGVG